jgi:hypothetical protein
VMEGRAPWCKRTTAPITSTSRTELLRDDGRGGGELAHPAGGFRAGTHREHRSVRDLRRAFSPALGVTVGVGAAPTRAGQKRRAGRPKHGRTPAVDTRRLLGGRSTTQLRIPRVALAAAMMLGPLMSTADEDDCLSNRLRVLRRDERTFSKELSNVNHPRTHYESRRASALERCCRPRPDPTGSRGGNSSSGQRPWNQRQQRGHDTDLCQTAGGQPTERPEVDGTSDKGW